MSGEIILISKYADKEKHKGYNVENITDNECSPEKKKERQEQEQNRRGEMNFQVASYFLQ